MNYEELRRIDDRRIKFMIDNDFFDKFFYLENVGYYLTTVYLDKYLDVTSTYIPKVKRKSLIEVFQRMRKKYNYAYYVKKPLNKIVCENKQKSTFTFVIDKDVRYPRIIFTNYSELNDYYKIELNPVYYSPDILKECLETMYNIKSSSKYVFEIYKQVDTYKYARGILDVPKRILSQLEMRYIFYQLEELHNTFYYEEKDNSNQLKFNPYETIETKNKILDLVYIKDECIEFSEILEFLNISEKDFYSITQKRKPTNGMFIKELNHLKKYLTLEYIYKKQLYPFFINKEELNNEEYKMILKSFIESHFNKLKLLYKLLVIEFKTYDVLEFHSEKYKRMFNYYKSQGYSKWQTQEIMRRYRDITEQMQIEPPKELLDMVDMFLDSYFREQYNDNMFKDFL